jgi:hypothetical protein
MAAHDNAHDVAAISEQVHRLGQRYPETSSATWIVTIVFGFLLVIPVVFVAIYLCAAFRVNGELGFVGGMAAWLGLFMLLRQSLLWSRNRKVDALVWEFNQAFPDGPARETALSCLARMDAEANYVVEQAGERLGAKKSTRQRGVLKFDAGYQAGGGLERAGDPEVDGRVEELLRPLDGKLRTLSTVQWVLAFGVPVAFFVTGCIFEPQAENMLWASLVILVVWSIVLAFIMGMIEGPIVSHSTEKFQQLFPKDGPQRAVAMAAFSRIRGCEKAKTALRSSLRDEEDDETQGDDEDGRQRPKPPRTQARPAPRHTPVASGPPALEPVSSAVPATPPPPVGAPLKSGAILLDPVVAPVQPPAFVPPPPPPPPNAAPSLEPAPSTGFCTVCGQRLRPDVQFCTNCGAKVTQR